MFRPIVALFIALVVLTAYAAPLTRRQLGDIQCNVNRLQIVGGLAKTKDTVSQLTTALANDTTASSAISTVADGIDGAQGAVGVIAKALLTGAAAPADARDQVAGNLTSAQTALASVNSTDSSVQSMITTAQSELDKSITAGQGVVSNCN